MTVLSEKPLATVQDLTKSWRALSPDESERAENLILQASNYLRQIARNNGKDVDELILADSSKVYGANVTTVICSCVQRSMSAPLDVMPEATQFSQSASPYSESMSFSGDTTTSLYFKAKELKLLGLGNVAGNLGIGLLRGVR